MIVKANSARLDAIAVAHAVRLNDARKVAKVLDTGSRVVIAAELTVLISAALRLSDTSLEKFLNDQTDKALEEGTK